MRILKLCLLGFVALLFAGCASVATTKVSTTDNRHPVFPQVAEAFIGNDYGKLEVLLSQELREQLSTQRFQVMVKDLEKNGKLVKVEYITDLRFPVADSELWKLVFCKTDKNDETVYTDKLLRVMTGLLDGRMQIIGIMVQ